MGRDPGLPDDWNSYWEICHRCGKEYHLSQCDQCACVHCEECAHLFPPNEIEEGVCEECEREAVELLSGLPLVPDLVDVLLYEETNHMMDELSEKLNPVA